MNKIPVKNYIILGTILIISVIAVLYINDWFKTAEKQLDKNDSMNFMKEIKTHELNNYITENPNFIIYIRSINNNNNKFEKKLKKFIIDSELQKEFIYIKLEEFNMEEYTEFINKYKINDIIINLNESIIIIENQKIIDILYKNEEFDIKQVKKFLKDNGVY